MPEELKKHIIDEINGAVDYMQKAVEHKGNACGERYRMYSADELKHANGLLSEFRAEMDKKSMTEAEHKMYKEILDTYAEGMTKLESMKKAYWAI